jgi:VWFA-related protein
MRLKSRILRNSLLIVLLAVVTLVAQDYQIRTRVDLVVVPVSVKSGDDHLVAGLQKEDFLLFENGTQQTIANFTADPVPLSAAVIIDTGLSAKSQVQIRKSLPALTGAFSEFDEVALYHYRVYVQKMVDFTKDMDVLGKGFDRLKEFEIINPQVFSAPFTSPGPVINGIPVAPSIEAGRRTPVKYSRTLNDAMFEAANDLAKRPIERRRIVIIVSDGRSEGNEHSYDQALTSLLSNDVQVFGIGMDAPFVHKLSLLDNYAKATGGDTFFLNTTEALERAYSRASVEARNQYVLAYFSTNKASGPLPQYREIAVKTVHPKMDVRHRQGYYQYP